MKKFAYFSSNIKLLIILSVLLNSLACSKENIPQTDSRESEINVKSSDDFVDISAILSYLNNNQVQTKNDGKQDFIIETYLGTKGDTLMYIVNFGNNRGWQILSSDSRTPAIIAEGSSGHFSLYEGNPGIVIWMDCLAEDMSIIRNANDNELRFSKEEILKNKSFIITM